jgi:hypothetical protein
MTTYTYRLDTICVIVLGSTACLHMYRLPFRSFIRCKCLRRQFGGEGAGSTGRASAFTNMQNTFTTIFASAELPR